MKRIEINIEYDYKNALLAINEIAYGIEAEYTVSIEPSDGDGSKDDTVGYYIITDPSGDNIEQAFTLHINGEQITSSDKIEVIKWITDNWKEYLSHKTNINITCWCCADNYFIGYGVNRPKMVLYDKTHSVKDEYNFKYNILKVGRYDDEKDAYYVLIDKDGMATCKINFEVKDFKFIIKDIVEEVKYE